MPGVSERRYTDPEGWEISVAMVAERTRAIREGRERRSRSEIIDEIHERREREALLAQLAKHNGRIPSLGRVRAEEIRRHFRLFIRASWRYVEPSETFVDNWHIDAIADHLTALYRGDIRRLIINMPPRHMKSIIASVMWPAWIWLQNPSFKMITGSYKRGLALRDGVRSRALMQTQFYRELNTDVHGRELFRFYDSKYEDSKHLKNTEEWYQNNKKGQRISVGVDSGATGEGGDLIAVDDPHNPKQALSDTQRAHALEWWDRTMSSRLNDLRTGRKLIIMQRLHTDDLSDHELEKNVGYTHLVLPGDFDTRNRCVTNIPWTDVDTGKRYQGWTDPREQDKAPLWPARFPPDLPEVIALKIDLGPYGEAGQWNQRPVPAGGGVFKRDWFKRWAMLPVFDFVALSVDCAFEDEETSSYVVIQAWGFKGAQGYALDQIRAHLSFTSTIAAIKDILAKYKYLGVSAKLIENKANGPAVINSLSKEIPGIIPIEPGRAGKLARAQAVSPFVAAGNVFLPEDAPWLSDFFVEVCNFPRAKTNDQVDAMSQMLNWAWLREETLEAQKRLERMKAWAGVKVGEQGSEATFADVNARGYVGFRTR